MKTLLTLLIVAVGLAGTARAEETKAAPAATKEKISYALGMNIGNNFKNFGLDGSDLDPATFAKAVNDILSGATPTLSDTEAREVLGGFQREMQTRQQEKRKQLGEKNKVEGEAFLAQNKSKAGIITLPSGLQYKVITNGTGAIPKMDDLVEVNYAGTLIDGTEFDSSYKRGQAYTTPLTRVVAGWTEALQLMKVGSKWQIFIPAELGYKEMGSGQKIGPNAVLIFDLELLAVKAPPPPPPPPAPVTSDIIKVPSAEELKKGAKIETIKAEDVEKEIAKEKAKSPPKEPEPK